MNHRHVSLFNNRIPSRQGTRFTTLYWGLRIVTFSLELNTPSEAAIVNLNFWRSYGTLRLLIFVDGYKIRKSKHFRHTIKDYKELLYSLVCHKSDSVYTEEHVEDQS